VGNQRPYTVLWASLPLKPEQDCDHAAVVLKPELDGDLTRRECKAVLAPAEPDERLNDLSAGRRLVRC
jgi:hypothetical protein